MPRSSGDYAESMINDRTFSVATFGHGVGKPSGGTHYEVFFSDGVRNETIARIKRESDAWSLCSRLRRAWARWYEAKAQQDRTDRVRSSPSEEARHG